MDPLTFATSFATIISLVGQFRSERGAVEQVEFDDFLVWLIESQNQKLSAFLESNERASDGVKELLSQNQNYLNAKLESIDQALTQFASGFKGFSKLASALRPNALLSSQAIDILRQLNVSGGHKLLESHSYDGLGLHILGGKPNSISISDSRFLEDDLRSLLDLGLLRHDLNGRGENLYIFTRHASELIESIDGKS